MGGLPGAWPAQTAPRQWPASSAGLPRPAPPRQAGPRDPDREEPARPDAQPHDPVIDPGHPHAGREPGANPAPLLQPPKDALSQAVPYPVSHEALSLPRTLHPPSPAGTNTGPLRSTGRSHPTDVSQPSTPRVHSQGAISSLPQDIPFPARGVDFDYVQRPGRHAQESGQRSLSHRRLVSAQNAHSGRSASGHLTVEPPIITAARRAVSWPIQHVASVPAIMRIPGTIAGVLWIFMQTVVSLECALMPRAGCRALRRVTLLVAQRGLVGFGDGAGPHGAQSLAQPVASLP